MDIRIDYQPTAIELAKTSFVFVEKKPIFLYGIGFINIFFGLILFILLVKLFYLGLALKEWITIFLLGIWLFGRRPLHEWILLSRMKSSPIVDKPIHIEISLNGIVWSGKGIRSGNMSWDQMKYAMETKNGFILPNAFTRFLWLPFRGFQSENDITLLRSTFMQKNIKLKRYKRWD